MNKEKATKTQKDKILDNEKNLLERKIDREVEKEKLLSLTESKVIQKGSDEALDRENEKNLLKRRRTLHGGIVASTPQPYLPIFPEEYYYQIHRLHGWVAPSGRKYIKPHKTAIITNTIIYGRFQKDVLDTLRIKNPYIGYCKREHKHFQWLTEYGRKLLKQYIDETIFLMQSCSSWYEFEEKLYLKHKIAYQVRLFK